MKKFLLSILCCLMAVVNGYAEKVTTYTVSSSSAVTVDSNAPEGSSATFKNTYTNNKVQLTKNNSMTLTLKGYAGNKITGISLSMKSNKSAGAGSFSAKVGATTISSISTANFNSKSWAGNYSQEYVDVTPAVTATEVGAGEDVVLKIAATVNSLYCESFTITYEPIAGGETGGEEPETPVAPDAPTLTASCSFYNAMNVKITNIPDGATVYYTTDGTTPSALNGVAYSTAFEITETTTVKAVAVKDELESVVVSATYTKNVVQQGEVIDVLTRDWTGIENGKTTYSSWSNLPSTSSAVYAGNSAGDNDAIQLRSNNSNSGIVTTVSGGKVKKIIVEWQADTKDGRTLNVYGKNSAYTDPTDLYNDSKSGKELGTIVKGTSTELEITGDYTYVGLRSNSGAMYITSITIIWEQSYTLKITDVGYATFTADKNFIIPAGVEGGIVTVEGTTANVNYVYTEGDIVPANTGLLMKGAQGEYKMYATTQEATEVYAENLLKGALTNEEITAPAGSLLYIFAKDIDSGLGFYWQNDSGNGQRVQNMAGKAYLQVPTTSAVKGFRLNLGDTTGITAVETTNGNAPIYTLSGVCVNGSLNNLPAGIYIVGGKKVYVK